VFGEAVFSRPSAAVNYQLDNIMGKQLNIYFTC